MRDLASIDAMVTAAVDAFGGIDILMNNAGITRYAPLLEVPESDWDSIMGVNAKGSFFTLQRVAKEMVARGQGGRIINMGSVVGKAAGPPTPPTPQARARSSHSPTRPQALWLSTTSTSTPSAPAAPRRKCSPECVDSEPQPWARPSRSTPSPGLAGVPLGRIIAPEDVARLAVFLMGPGGYNITGQTINIDGGVLMN